MGYKTGVPKSRTDTPIPPRMDKQDKTAIDFLKENVEMLWSHQEIGTYSPLVISAMESYAQHRTAELEAKIKALESELHSEIHDNGILHKKVEALEERLEAADEVIQASRSIKLYATHGLIAEDYNKALEKYNSLKK